MPFVVFMVDMLENIVIVPCFNYDAKVKGKSKLRNTMFMVISKLSEIATVRIAVKFRF